MTSIEITAAQARAVFEYAADTGVVTRKVKTSGSAVIGPLNARDNGDGYSRVTLFGHRVYLHRLAWLLHYGAWPEGHVDHIDGDRSNNAINNLRDVDHTANAQNVHVAHSSTGLLGAYYEPGRNRFIARISVGPRGKAKSIYLGRFATAQAAHDAYLMAKAKLHPAASIAATQEAA
ncbi:MAG: HNH endonuclease signature motif containing protein [Sphingopyxis sp.]